MRFSFFASFFHFLVFIRVYEQVGANAVVQSCVRACFDFDVDVNASLVQRTFALFLMFSDMYISLCFVETDRDLGCGVVMIWFIRSCCQCGLCVDVCAMFCRSNTTHEDEHDT